MPEAGAFSYLKGLLVGRPIPTHPYDHVAAQLSVRSAAAEPRRHNAVLVPISGIQQAVLGALSYARTLAGDVRAVYVDLDPAATEQIRSDWTRWGGGTRLVTLPSPFRSLMEPLLEYVEAVQAAPSRHERAVSSGAVAA